MSQDPPNHRKPWSAADDAKLDKLIGQNTPTPLASHKLGRTEDAVRSHVSETGRSLAPTNKSPYNRRGKG